MPAHQADARRVRLATIVTVACGLVALGVTGTGLLLPAGGPTPSLRVVGALVAIAAGGILVRTEGAARSTTTVTSVAIVGLLVCLATLPVSPVTAPWNTPADPADAPPAPDGSDGVGPDVVIEPGAPGGGGGTGALALPPGADVVVEQGAVVLVLPDGGRITIGQAIAGADPAVGTAGTAVVVVDGVAERADGGALGADVALGGTTLQRGDGSQVSVGDGALLDVPAPLTPDDADPTDGLDALLAVLLGCFALLAFAPPVIRFGDRAGVSLLEPSEPEGDDGEPVVPTTVEEGLAEVLRSMLADPDPRTSVIGAYARLLTALAEAGFPRRDEEAPHEHLWRSLGPLGVRRQPVHQLAELFVRARFTPRPVTEEHRQAAIAALADAVADLRLQATDVREVAARVGVSA